MTTASILPAPVGGKVVGPATIALTAKDDSSGIKMTEYGLDGGPLKTYTGPITVASLETTRSTTGPSTGPERSRRPSTCRSPWSPPHPAARSAPSRGSRSGSSIRSATSTASRSAARTGVPLRGSPSTRGGKSARREPGLDLDRHQGPQLEPAGSDRGQPGKFDTLLRLTGKRTVVFSLRRRDRSAKAKVRIATMPRRR